MISLPARLYDTRDALRVGGAGRACKYLMSLRVEHLLEQQSHAVGLRRAMHACTLIDIVYNAYHKEKRDTWRAHALFGFFRPELTAQVVQRLIESEATLQEDEKHFADMDWWKNLDRDQALHQLESNLLRMIANEATICLTLGIELHVLFDMYMRYVRIGGEYDSLIKKYSPKFPNLDPYTDRFLELLTPAMA